MTFCYFCNDNISSQSQLLTIIIFIRCAKYEPENFANLTWKFNRRPRITLNISKTGKVFVSNATSEDDIHTAMQRIYARLVHYQW